MKNEDQKEADRIEAATKATVGALVRLKEIGWGTPANDARSRREAKRKLEAAIAALEN